MPSYISGLDRPDHKVSPYIQLMALFSKVSGYALYNKMYLLPDPMRFTSGFPYLRLTELVFTAMSFIVVLKLI